MADLRTAAWTAVDGGKIFVNTIRDTQWLATKGNCIIYQGFSNDYNLRGTAEVRKICIRLK